MQIVLRTIIANDMIATMTALLDHPSIVYIAPLTPIHTHRLI